MKIKLREMGNIGGKRTFENDAKVNYFTLKDKESGKFRFLFSKIDEEEFEAFAVHQYKDGKLYKKFHCPRGIGGTDWDSCIVCQTAGQDPNKWQKQIVYIPLQNVETGEILIWERSLKYFQNNILSPLLMDKDVCDGEEIYSTIFKIARFGVGTDTTYNIVRIKTDDEVMPDVAVPNASKYIAKKTLLEMTEFLRTGEFPVKEYKEREQFEPTTSNQEKEQLATTQPAPWESIPDDDVPF